MIIKKAFISLSLAILVLFFLFQEDTMAQVNVPVIPQIVTDPTSYAHLTDQLLEAKKQVDILKEAQTLVSKVNSAVREIHLMQQIIDNQIYISKQVRDTYEKMESSEVFSVSELQRMLLQLTMFVTASQQTIALANKIIEDGLFKMGDYERVEFLMQLKRDMEETRALVYSMRSTYMQAMQLRILKRTFTKQGENGR